MQIIVDEKIRIKNPTPAIKDWCRYNLILDNPDFYKLERMGKWTGRTPKTITLYEVVGDEWWLPFGCLQNIWQMCVRGISWNVQISPVRAFSYESHINLYPYQKKAVEAAIGRKNGILVMPCGSGKTQSGLQAIAQIGGRALWLTHTQDLLNQSKKRAETVLENVGCGTITAGKVNIGEGITFATVQTMANIDLAQYRDYWDVIIVDECMPANTLINTPTGQKELKNLRIDDIITSYNRTTGKIENKKVIHIFKSKAHDIVNVKLSNGEKITCTGNHPIFTQRGWIDAERLESNDYVMRLVWQGSGYRIDAKNIKKESIGKRILFLLKKMFSKRSAQIRMERGAQAESIGENERNEQSVSRSVCEENENKQSNEKSRCPKGCIKKVKRDGASSEDQMWEWSRLDSATAGIDACISRAIQCLCRISCAYKKRARKWISYLLQDRYCNSRRNDCDRSRWKFSLCNRKAGAGQEKGYVFESVRVESVEIQEQTSDGTFGGLCPDGYVYNIEVEDNNNYYADGYLVHNCQHCAGSPTKVTQFYKVMSMLCARYKIGLTATPHRADGLEMSMFALLGGIIHEVKREEVAHTTCPIRITQINTGWYPADDVTMYDGTIDYNKVIESLTHDDDRYNIVFGEIMTRCKGATIILANRVEYLQTMCEDMQGYGKKAICLSGMGQSKKAKAERKEALRELNEGELDVIFCTYQLAAEGLDVPNLRYVVLATPEKDRTRVIQSVGRVGRKADGKECGTVIDFVDDFGMYKGWAKKRAGYYKEIGAEIIG